MIKLTRPQIPEILRDNHPTWTNDLEEAVNKYGSYKDIPNAEREDLIKHYRQKEIKDALVKASHGKCAFCEAIPGEGGFIEVEHFAPKSIHYKKTFEWENLLPSCKQCNIAKGTHDTVAESIIDPMKDDPELFIDFSDLKAVPSIQSPDVDVSERTIRILKLNQLRTYKSRGDLLATLYDFETQLESCCNEIQQLKTEKGKLRRLDGLSEAITKIELLTEPHERYAAYCRAFLRKSKIYQEAIKLRDDLYVTLLS